MSFSKTTRQNPWFLNQSPPTTARTVTCKSILAPHYLSIQIPNRLRMFISSDDAKDPAHNNDSTLQTYKKNSTLAAGNKVRLFASAKMRVKSTRPSFKPHLFQPVYSTAPNLQTERMAEKVVFKATIKHPLTAKRSTKQSIKQPITERQNYLTQSGAAVDSYSHLLMSSLLENTDIGTLREKIQSELRRREIEFRMNMEKKQQKKIEIQQEKLASNGRLFLSKSVKNLSGSTKVNLLTGIRPSSSVKQGAKLQNKKMNAFDVNNISPWEFNNKPNIELVSEPFY